MAATAGRQAGIEANQTRISYAVEATWTVRPLVAFQAIRSMGSSLALTKTRARPSEINLTREVSQAVTTQQQAGGTINYALSYGTYDDFFASLMQNDWTPPYSIVSITTDITFTAIGSNNHSMSSTLASKFTSINIGQYIRVSGFTTLPAMNGYYRVYAKADNSHISITGKGIAAGSETSAGANVLITGSTLSNGSSFRSLFIQQRLGTSKYFRYGGAYPTRITMSGSVGNFFTGTIDLVMNSEVSSTVDASTGTVINEPNGAVFDPVSGWVAINYNLGAVAGLIDQFSLTLENTGAQPEFSLGGSAGADGILGGTFTASGAMRMYCKDFTLYNDFQAEFSADMQVYLKDAQLNSYVFSFQQVTMFCKVNSTGPGTAVMVDITFEVNPDPTLGGTFQIDRHPPPH